MIANADVYFDQTLQFFYEKIGEEQLVRDGFMQEIRYEVKSFPNQTLISLLKWMDRPDVLGITLRTDSQDAWIFQPPIPASIISQTDFYLGLPRCDNRLIDIFQQYHYTIINPAFQLHAIEIQQSNTRYGGNHNGTSDIKNYRNSLYGMKNAVLGNGKNVFVADYFTL